MKKPIKERPVLPGRLNPQRKIYDERGVSPVIAVILMVAITVVLAGVLYVMIIAIIGDPNITPNGAMVYDETDPEKGIYRGSLIRIDRSVKLDEASITITDVSTTNSASMNPLSDRGIASCGVGQMNITYQDVNADGKLNSGDVFYIYNGEEDDVIQLTYNKGSGGQICEFTLR